VLEICKYNHNNAEQILSVTCLCTMSKTGLYLFIHLSRCQADAEFMDLSRSAPLDGVYRTCQDPELLQEIDDDILNVMSLPIPCHRSMIKVREAIKHLNRAADMHYMWCSVYIIGAYMYSPTC
jgi:hypothetical protein